jgi:histone H3/H4
MPLSFADDDFEVLTSKRRLRACSFDSGRNGTAGREGALRCSFAARGFVNIGRARRATGGTMAARKKVAKKAGRKAGKKAGSGELLISKSRVKAATKKCNVGGDFYGALDAAVRTIIAGAESRAISNKRKTLKPQDI